MAKPINQQVVVITGASSGIGKATALLLARRGARVALAARSDNALDDAVNQITRDAGQAVAIPTDVTARDQVDRLAQQAIERFGQIDTWINDAGTSMYAAFTDSTEDEIRQIFNVNVMGVIFGMQAALRHMMPKQAGTIINIASVAGKRGLPLQSIYSASKFAIVGLGEAVRTEMLNTSSNVEICTVCPPSVDTPFFDRARTKEENLQPKPPQPVYSPEYVAEVIVGCAEKPQRETVVGLGGKGMVFLSSLAPKLADWFMSRRGVDDQLTTRQKSPLAKDSLFTPSEDTRVNAGWDSKGERPEQGDVKSSGQKVGTSEPRT